MGLKTVRLGLLVYMKLNWTKCMQYWLDLFTLCNESRTRVENRMNNIYISDCTYICYNPTHCCSAWAWPPPHQSTLPCLTPLSTPIYWGSKAWLNFLATPQSTLVFFGTKAKPFSTITFYSSHPFSLPCHTPLLSTVGLRPHPFLQTLSPSLRITEKWPFSQNVTLQMTSKRK